MTIEKPIHKPNAVSVKESGSLRSVGPVTVLSVPAANIDETEQEYIITLAAPGFDREHFNIELKDPLICISARKRGVSQALADRKEYDFSGWERKFFLPEDADTLMTTAYYLNGELCIHVPRSARAVREKGQLKIYVY